MAGYLEIAMDQGASFNTTVTLIEANSATRNLVSATVASQMRKSYQSIVAFDINTVVADGANGVISLSMSEAATANLKAGRYVYDVKTTDTQGYSQRVLEGIVVVSPGVTRS